MSTLGKQELEKEAIAIVQGEVRKWTDAEVWLTDKVRFRIRDLIRTCRKNYWGVFDRPKDKITGREKIWQPLTEELVDSVAPKIRVTKKDVGTVARTKDGIPTSEFIRLDIHNYLDLIDGYQDFGEFQDANEISKCIDGTTIKKVTGKGKNTVTSSVDLLNLYIDPHTRSIQSAYRVVERSLMSEADMLKTDWINTDVKATDGLHPTDEENHSDASSTTKGIDTYELWGKIPERLITGKSEDNKEIDGQIVVSGIMGNGNPVVHAIRRNANKNIKGDVVKPYEEDVYIKVPGRFYGKGVAEKLIPQQLYLNIIVNIRINRSYVSQLGIFKIRKGSQITPDQFKKLSSNGAITVSNMDDIEQMVMQEASQASYTDEANIRSISQKLTSAFEVVTGEGLAASTPATNAVIQNKNALTTFTRIQDRSGQSIKRWLRQVVSRRAEGWDTNDIISIYGDDAKFNQLIDRVATYLVREDLYAANKVPSEQAIVREFNKVKNQLRKDGSMFVKNLKELVLSAIDVRVIVTNEDLDTAVAVDKLMNMLQMVPEVRVPIVKQVFDLLQLPIPAEFEEQLGGLSDQINQNIAQGGGGEAITGEIPQTVAANTTSNSLSQ